MQRVFRFSLMSEDTWELLAAHVERYIAEKEEKRAADAQAQEDARRLEMALGTPVKIEPKFTLGIQAVETKNSPVGAGH